MQKPGTSVASRLLAGKALSILSIALLVLVSLLLTFQNKHQAEAATSSTLNFQARLLNSSGAIVPDGYYNIEFNLYSVSSGGSTLWTETWYDANGVTAGQDNRIQVRSGYVSVYLGNQTSFPTNINWDQELWLTMNVGGTAQSSSPTWDGEMSPRLKLTAVPYAFKAGQLAKLTGGNTSTLDFDTQTGARTILLPDASGTLCIQGSASCLFNTDTSITLQDAYNATSGNSIATTDNRNLTISLADTATDADFIVDILGTGNTFEVRDGGNDVLSVVDGGGVTLQNTVDSTSGFAVYDADGGTPILNVDTTNERVGVGTAAPTVALDVVGTPIDSTYGSILKVSGTAASTTNDQVGSYSQLTVAPGGASARTYIGAAGEAVTTSTNLATATLIGSAGRVINNGTGNINIAVGVSGVIENNSSGVLATAASFYVTNPVNPSGTITSNYGILLADQTAGTNDYGIAIAGADTQALWIGSGANNTDAANGIAFGNSRDTNLYRSAADTLRTDDNFVVGGTTQTFAGASGTITTSTASAALTVSTAAGSGAGTGGVITLQAGAGGASSGQGGSVSILSGAAGGGTANGGNINITAGAGSGATGSRGLVVINTPTFQTASTQNCAGADCTITQANVDSNGAVGLTFSSTGFEAGMPDPNNTTAGRIVYVNAVAGTSDFTLCLNDVAANASYDGTCNTTSGNSISMRANTSATLIWNGSDWTAAGASSSTDLQAAYNNTLTSAGGAELVLNAAGGAADGLTIRNNSTTPITGGLLEVQTSIGSNLFTVNNNATEYANNGGAETSTFTMWAAAPAGGSVSRYTTAGNNIATGAGSTFADTTSTANTGIKNTLSSSLTANLKYKVSYTVRHTSSTATFTTLDTIYSADGTATTATCASGSTATYNTWTRVDCTFTATSVGASNAIIIRHSDAVEHDFYVDNLSVTVSADVSHAVDGSVDSALGSNWQAYDADGGAGTSTPTRDTTNIYDTSGAVAVATTAGASEGIGVRNNMSITPSVSTQYLVTFYAKSTTAFSDIRVGFLPAGGSSLPVSAQLCNDYNTNTVSTSTWTKITCIITTPSSGISDPDLVIYQGSAAARTFYVDALSITLNTNNSSNVQIGGANKGGPTTLFTLDRSSSAPIANNNDAYLGSMYYDTTTGRIQCYEADGWGACGAAPDNYVNLNPEYAGAVLNGTGVGTMTADFCANQSGVLQVNYVASTDPCYTSGDVRNYYKWTSPQATQQTYSIYVTYQLPATFRGFASDDTVQLAGRADSTSNAAVTYQMYAKQSSGGSLTQCGTGETTVVTSTNTWQSVGISGNESTGCSLSSTYANGFVIFKINMKANSNASAYVSTLSFTTNGQ